MNFSEIEKNTSLILEPELEPLGLDISSSSSISSNNNPLGNNPLGSKQSNNPNEIINLQFLLDDYQLSRENILSGIKNSMNILNDLALSIQTSSILNTELINAYASLSNSTNTTIKNLLSLYKEISGILLDIKNLNKSKKNDENEIVISTSDIIEKLRDLKS